MGFEAPETVYKLDFSDTPYAGLEVAVRGGTIGDFLDLEDLVAEGKMRQVFRRFAGVLESWNVTRKGEAVPTTYEGLLSLEPALVEMIVTVWQRYATEAPPPLPGGSPSGGTSPEALIAAASKSRSPGS